jgi:hypothetical protein
MLRRMSIPALALGAVRSCRGRKVWWTQLTCRQSFVWTFASHAVFAEVIVITIFPFGALDTVVLARADLSACSTSRTTTRERIIDFVNLARAASRTQLVRRLSGWASRALFSLERYFALFAQHASTVSLFCVTNSTSPAVGRVTNAVTTRHTHLTSSAAG